MRGTASAEDARVRRGSSRIALSSRKGAAITFRAGAAESFHTLRAPQGWHTNRGIKIGDPETTVTAIYGTLPRAECGTYSALVLRRGSVETQFYVYDGKVWGCGLSSVGAPRCH